MAAVLSGCRSLGEQVAHRARLAAEKLAEQRAGARETSLAGGYEGAEREPSHELRGAVRDHPGYPFLVVDGYAPDVAAGQFGGDGGNVAERCA